MQLIGIDGRARVAEELVQLEFVWAEAWYRRSP